MHAGAVAPAGEGDRGPCGVGPDARDERVIVPTVMVHQNPDSGVV